jgi:hypothetical protein
MSGSRAKIIRKTAMRMWHETRYSNPKLSFRHIYQAMKRAYLNG